MILPQLNHHNRPYGILLKPEEQVPQNGRLYSSNNNLQLLVLLQSLALSPEWTARKAASTGVSKYSPSRMRTVQTYVNGNAITACIWNVRNLGRSNSLSTDCHGGSSSHLTSKSTSLSPPHRSSSTFQYEFRNSFIFYPLRQARFDVQCYRNASAIWSRRISSSLSLRDVALACSILSQMTNYVFLVSILSQIFRKIVVVSEGSAVRGSTMSQPKALTGAEALWRSH